MIDKKRSFRFIGDCILVAALACVFALNYELFVAPNRFAPSGVNGIAAMLEYVTDGAFSVGYFSLIVNVPLCLLAFFLIDRGFAVKTSCQPRLLGRCSCCGNWTCAPSNTMRKTWTPSSPRSSRGR